MRSREIAAGSLTIIALALAAGQGNTGHCAPPADAESYQAIVTDDQPVAFWRFSGEDPKQSLSAVTPQRPSPALKTSLVGNVSLNQEGPRPDEFPLFTEDNSAIEITGMGYLQVADPGPASPLDFTNGDSITLEAWVRPDTIRNGGYAYVLGKGRTQNSGFPLDNQNYALRLAGDGGTAAVTFLFRSAGPKPDWHRWTSVSGAPVDGGWHHVAVTYTFGQPDSIRGYVDGEAVTGKWDMGGATDQAPVVDDDELWIGSSMGGSTSSTFQGGIDEVAIYRSALSIERIAARYQCNLPTYDLAPEDIPQNFIRVDVFEGISDKPSWQIRRRKLADTYRTKTFAFSAVPNKYTASGVKDDWSDPFLLRATGRVTLPAGPQRILLRCRNGARLYLDGKKIAETAFHRIGSSGHAKVVDLDTSLAPNIRPLQRGDTQSVAEIDGDGQSHVLQLEVIVGGRKRRAELGETSVSIAKLEGEFHLLGYEADFPLTDEGWNRFVAHQQQELIAMNRQRRIAASIEETQYWDWRHELARRVLSEQPRVAVPDVSASMPVVNNIDRFIGASLEAAGEQSAPLAGDLEFLRRLFLDTVGTIPSAEQIDEFLADESPDRRSRWIDRLLASDGWADNWVGYWQDVLAENPNIVNPTLNNTGPFRWWIHESFLENKPFDRFVTELVMMEGSRYYGGPAGFELATENDAPMAAKAHIIGQAFMALEMKCARCHDAPYHDFLQRDLFSLAAMLRRAPQEVPASSTIPGGDDAVGSLLVEVTLKPGEKIPPEWAFTDHISADDPDGIMRKPEDSRDRLAALMTSPRNDRFARVIVNRLWHRYLGRGLVEPVDDWEEATPSHPELLDYLAEELVANNYDLKHSARLILNSHTYQRTPRSDHGVSSIKPYLFAAPIQRRMSAEQVVDSLFVAAGKPFDAGRMSIDIDGSRPASLSLDLGIPSRAWQFASLSNERDRPSLALPFAQPFVTLMETFGWRSSRQDPLTVRNQDPTVLQPAVMANGTLSDRIARLSDDHGLTEAALQPQPLDALIDRIYLQLLTRYPTPTEQALFIELLQPGYEQRCIDAPLVPRPELPRGVVSWSNHLAPEANEIKTQLEAAVRRGDPPTARLENDWRERMEDMVWTLVNSPEFVFIP